ncbi:Histone-lysine N-methyltransferase [Bertholletia excelsa]
MIEIEQHQQQPEMEEETMQLLRSKAAELLLREEWNDAIQAYSHCISICQRQLSRSHEDSDLLIRLRKSLCIALSSRAEAHSRLRDFRKALQDCDEALKIEDAHFRTLLCKGKALLSLNRYGNALDCFKLAFLDPQGSENSESINGYLEKCKKLEILSRTGAFDCSDWIVNGFRGKPPELAEYVGGVEIKRSEMGGRGLFATKNIEIGTLLIITKAIATERGIIPTSSGEDLGESAQLVMWKNFIERVLESARKYPRTHDLICRLSSGEREDELEVPDMSLFRPEVEEKSSFSLSDEEPDKGRILSILDVNSLVEDTISAKVLGKNRDYYGVGLWLLASFINHSCCPNARRLHVGDFLIIHASRDIKADEEVTFAYFDVLSPLGKRREMARNWGFDCGCKRCKFEEGVCGKQEMREIGIGIERGLEMGGVLCRLEESTRRLMVKGRAKGFLRASFWGVYNEVFESEKAMRRWGRKIPAIEVVVESVLEAVGSDERVLKVLMEGLKRNGSGVGGNIGMERAMKIGRGIYGKVMKKHAMRTLLELLPSGT